jgi:hypothetical protein
MSPGPFAPTFAIALSTIVSEVLVGQLRREIALDQRGLGLLGRGAVGVPRVLERLGRLAPALQLATQHGLGLVLAQRPLRRLLGISQ